MFLDIVQAVVFSCFVPVMYIVILVFAFLLIRGGAGHGT